MRSSAVTPIRKIKKPKIAVEIHKIDLKISTIITNAVLIMTTIRMVKIKYQVYSKKELLV